MVKKPLRIAILEFYKLILNKGQKYTVTLQKSVHRAKVCRAHLIRRIKMKQKEIDQDIVIKMFDHLKGFMLQIKKAL